MRLMTRAATLKAHGSVFKRKGPAFIPVAVEASRLVGAERLQHRWTDAAVRIVAIDTGHGAFGQFMVIRLLELRPYIQVATGALFVDGGSLADHQIMSPIRMNLMTGRARNLVLHVAALEAPHVRRLVQVTIEADLVGGNRGKFARIADIRGGSRLYMFLARPVAGLTGPSFKSTSLLGFDGIVRALLKSLENIFMAGPANFRTHIAGRKRRLGYAAAGREKEDRPARTQVNIAHAPGQRQKQCRRCDKLCMLRRATRCWKACVTPPEDLDGNRNRLKILPGWG